MSIASFFRRPGNEWALQMAKHNLVKHYLVVGITEQLGDFVAVLEAALPRFFAGATELYQSGTVGQTSQILEVMCSSLHVAVMSLRGR